MHYSKKNGNAIVELVMVMVLLMLFGITMYQIINQGSITERKIIDKKMAQVDARIALSFINVRLKQNDIKDKIDVKEHNGKNSIVIKERSEEYDHYDTWIFFEDGNLLECITDPDEFPDKMKSIAIAKIDDFKIDYNRESRTLENTVYYSYEGREDKSFSQNSIISLRNDQRGEQ